MSKNKYSDDQTVQVLDGLGKGEYTFDANVNVDGNATLGTTGGSDVHTVNGDISIDGDIDADTITVTTSNTTFSVAESFVYETGKTKLLTIPMGHMAVEVDSDITVLSTSGTVTFASATDLASHTVEFAGIKCLTTSDWEWYTTLDSFALDNTTLESVIITISTDTTGPATEPTIDCYLDSILAASSTQVWTELTSDTQTASLVADGTRQEITFTIGESLDPYSDGTLYRLRFSGTTSEATTFFYRIVLSLSLNRVEDAISVESVSV